MLLCCAVTLCCTIGHSQRGRLRIGYGFVGGIRVNRHKARTAKEESVKSPGTINVSGNEYNGNLTMFNNRVVYRHKKGVETYNYSDTSLHSIKADVIGGPLCLVRAGNIDNKIWRLIKDTLGVQIMDKQLLHIAAAGNADFHNLVFVKGADHFYASGSMFSSTKKNMVKILNQLWGLHLEAKNFKDKQEIIDRLIHNDKSVYG